MNSAFYDWGYVGYARGQCKERNFVEPCMEKGFMNVFFSPFHCMGIVSLNLKAA